MTAESTPPLSPTTTRWPAPVFWVFGVKKVKFDDISEIISAWNCVNFVILTSCWNWAASGALGEAVGSGGG